MLVQRIQRIVRLLGQIAYSLYITPLKEAVIDFADLTLSHKILAMGGYFSIALMLIMTLFFELFPGHLALVSYTGAGNADPVAKQVPLLVMATSGLGVALGWAFILTGATDCRPHVFVPVLAFFGFQLFVLTAGAGSKALAGDLLYLTAPLVLASVLGVYLLTHRKPLWRDFPLVEFAIWFCVMAFYMVGHWVAAPTLSTVAEMFDGTFSILAILAVPWWLVSGLVLISLALDTGRKLTTTLRRLFPKSVLQAITTFVLLLYPILLVYAIAFGDEATPLVMAIMGSGFLVLPMILAMMALMLFKRWTLKNTATLLTLAFALPVFALGVAMSFAGADISDVVEMTVQSTGVLPPILLFVALMAYNVLSVGASFGNSDGKIMPRTGRILLGFGVALLVISFTVFFVNTQDRGTGELDAGFQNATDAFFGLGLFFLGLPYLIWTAWKRRDTLAGDEAALADTIPLFVWVEGSMGRWGVVILTIVVVILACLLCLVGLLFIQPLP